MSLKKSAVVVLTAVAITASGVAVPAMAGEYRARFDASRLDKADADYSYYRGRGWGRGNRNAAIAGAVGLGLLGAAAIAASRPAYSDSYYYDDGYGYSGGYQPTYVYEEPRVIYQEPRYYGGYYGPGNYYSQRGPYSDFYNGAPDPARGGK